jgi:hypothetical protein
MDLYEDRLDVTVFARLRLGVPVANRVRIHRDSVEYETVDPPSGTWRPGSAEEIVTQLNNARVTPLWPLVLAGLVVLGSVTPWLSLVGLPGLVWIALRDRVRRTVLVFYEIDEPVRSAYYLLDGGFPREMNRSGPPHLRTDVPVPSLASSPASVFLLPDRVLVCDGGKYRDTAYEHVTFGTSQQNQA